MSIHKKYENYDNCYDNYYDSMNAKNLLSMITNSTNYIDQIFKQAACGGDTRFVLLERSCV